MDDGVGPSGEDFHLLDQEKALEKLGSRASGLKDAEVKKRLLEHGPNALAEGEKDPKWKKFLRQFTDALVIILLMAAVITALLEPHHIDWIVISAIVMINAIIGYLQEEKAEDAIERLKKLAAPKAMVFRSGKREEVKASELVPGDIIYMESGMKVPADGRLIESSSMKVNESALTGESIAVEKSHDKLSGDIPLAERTNMLYLSTVVETGRGRAVVTSTGMDTEIGHIAGMIQSAERVETPLQKRLQRLGKRLGLIILIACVIIFSMEIVREFSELDMTIINELFKTSVSLAVAAIPEGLPAVVTISLAIGLKVMAKRNVIVRKLPVVETLGSATVICTDKTGTLTTGTMTADVLFVGKHKIDIEGTGYSPQGGFKKRGIKIDPKKQEEGFEHIMMASALSSDASVSKEGDQYFILGDTTEGAIMVMAQKAGFDYEELRKENKRIDELPFDSGRKMMSTVHKIDDGRVAYSKGAPERILEVCNEELVGTQVTELTERRRKELIVLTEKMARRGYRTLAFSYDPDGDMEEDMVFLGIVGIRDKVRPEAKEAVAKTKKAGIRVMMITGDHKLTATAIGKEIGLIQKEEQAMNCRDLDAMEDEEFQRTLSKVSVYARASPEHKVRIVRGLKKTGNIVSMTGDGVNDAPALKIADIGVAMGITGTDVTKDASDMIITDDNFASMVGAVEEGRGIYDNIRKVIQFLLSCNMGEVLVVFIALLLDMPLPLIALQILWMNLVTDSFPALALVTEPKESDLMERKPRDPNESVITKDMAISIMVSACIITLGTLVMFWYNYRVIGNSLELSRTVALTTMVMFQMWTAIACRSTTHSLSEIGWFSNPRLLGAITLAIVLMMPIIYLPALQGVFGTVALGMTQWSQIIVISITGLIAVEAWESINRRYLHYGAATPGV